LTTKLVAPLTRGKQTLRRVRDAPAGVQVHRSCLQIFVRHL
jgi:hypothetical protein